jgi:hypothetical protein
MEAEKLGVREAGVSLAILPGRGIIDKKVLGAEGLEGKRIGRRRRTKEWDL